MKLITFLSAIAFLLSCVEGVAQSPGGVSTNLQFWVKGDLGAGTVGSASSQWTDQSGKGYNATQATTAAQPTLTANQINFHPSLVFNGTSDYMDVPNVLGLTGTGAYAVYCVVKQGGSGVQVFLGTTNGSSSPASNDMQFYVSPGSPITVDLFSTGTVLSGTTNNPAGIPYIAGHERTGTGTNGATIYLNGNLDKTGTIPETLGTYNKRIGSSFASSGNSFFVNGDIAEIVVYNAALSSSDRLKLQSYLSFKYGLPPPAGSGFTASDGTTAFWTYNATYTNNIFGIGRDDGSGLSMSSSNSYNTGSGNGSGQSGSGNVVLSNPSALNNKDFIVLGNDNGALTEQTTNLPAGAGASVKRLGRQWKVNHTNAAGTTVTYTFNTTGLTTGSSVTDYSLLIDNDGDGNFATGTVNVKTAASYSSNIVTFNTVNLPNNAVLALVTRSGSTLPLDFISFTARLDANRAVDLQWETSHEIDVSRFAIERSSDGIGFTSIGEVDFSSNLHAYTFTDAQAGAGNDFYRIKSVDLDGNYTYSPIREVTLPLIALQAKILNNQVGQGNPVLQFSAMKAQTVTIQLLTMDGKTVRSLENKLAAGNTQVVIMTDGLAGGSYIVAVKGAGYSKDFLMVK